MIHVDAAESPQAEWTQAVVRLMAAEARAVQPGGEAVVTRLADVLAKAASIVPFALARAIFGMLNPLTVLKSPPKIIFPSACTSNV